MDERAGAERGPVPPGPGAPTEILPATPAAEASADAPAPSTTTWPATGGPEQGPTSPFGGEPVPVTPREPGALDEFTPDDGRRRWPRQLAVALGVVLVLGAAYVGAAYALADRVPRATSVAGVQLGGLSSARAQAALTDGLADRTSGPIMVVAQGSPAQLDPAQAGLTLDAEATVDALTGVDLADPGRLWRQIVGGGEQDPVSTVDEDALASAVDALGDTLHQDPVDGAIVFADGNPHTTNAQDGWELDAEAAARSIESGWLVADEPIELATSVVTPAIDQEATQAALQDSAIPLTRASITVAVAGRAATLTTPTLAAAASYTAQDGELVLQLDGSVLADSVLSQLPDLLTPAADAHFDLSSGSPVIVPGAAGTTLDPAALAPAVQAASTAADRTATVELSATDPAESTAALEALGVKEIVSEFATPLTAEPRRTVNITNGAAKISGTLVKPGETFSLTDALGPIDADHGFVEAGAIVNGEHTDAWGGGLSQISTTTYNAAYFAGFEDVEHRPHSEWFARYPEGREATIFTGTLDMRWKNTSPYGALVQAWVADNQMHVRIWGTKYFTVESSTSARSNVKQPTTVYSQSPTCETQKAGNPGFTVTVTRRVLLNGEQVSTESNTWTYKAQNAIVCGPAPTG